LDKSWQKKFPNATKCCRCGENSRIAFVYHEDQNQENYVADLHERNKQEGEEKGKLWPHDSIAVATYFCEKCLEPTSLYNQA